MGIDIDLSGKVAAITGGSRGIGRGIAEALLKTGASVAINGRNEEKGRQAIKEIGENQSVAFIKGDVRKQSEAENFIARTIEEEEARRRKDRDPRTSQKQQTSTQHAQQKQQHQHQQEHG